MSNRIRSLLSKAQQRKVKSFTELPSWLLVLLGAMSAAEAWWWGKGFASVGPSFADAINNGAPITPLAAVIATALLLLATATWFFGTVAARCAEVLKKRHFD